MAQITAFDPVYARPVFQRRGVGGRVGSAVVFAACVFMVLTFSQGWLTLLVGPEADPEASGLIRAAYIPAYGVALLLAVVAPGRTLGAALLNPLLLLLIGLTFVSWTWSIQPDVTLRRAVALGFTTLAGLVIGSRYGWRRLSELLASGFALIALASLVLGLLLPQYGRMQTLFPGAWRGVFQEKNALGAFMAVSACVSFAAAALNPPRRRLWTTLGLISLALIALSTSKTAMVSGTMGLGMLAFVFLVRRGPAAAVVTLWLGVTLLTAGAIGLWMNSDAVLAAIGKDASLTGRTQIWTAELREIATRPLLGFGYGAVWTNSDPWAPLAEISKEVHFSPRHAHNGWLEARLGLGWVGLAIWSLVAAETVCKGVWTTVRSRGGYLVLPFLTVYFFTSLTESNAFIYNDLTWVVFVALCARMALGDEVRRTA